MKIFLLLGLLICFSETKSQASFDIQLIGATEREINIKTTFTNKSNKTIKVAKYRNVDYIRDGITAIGTYIIEFQKYQEGLYKLLTPTADIDPAFSSNEFIRLNKQGSISDTLLIHSRIFRDQDKSDFFPGRYRVRIAFNTTGWQDKKPEFSEWIEFVIN